MLCNSIYCFVRVLQTILNILRGTVDGLTNNAKCHLKNVVKNRPDTSLLTVKVAVDLAHPHPVNNGSGSVDKHPRLCIVMITIEPL